MQVAADARVLLGSARPVHRSCTCFLDATLNFGRFKLGAMCIGGCRGVIGESARYAAQRRQFNQPIAFYHGSDPNGGTNWDNNYGTTKEASIIRIGGVPSGSGIPGDEECIFYTPFGHHEPVPEPASLVVWLGLALAALAFRQSR